MIIGIEVHSEEGESPKDFYARVHSAMCRSGLDWCSTDDWYDDGGDVVPEEARLDARHAVLVQQKEANT